ncbi:MAG: hypothetical protein HZA54_20340 [Planctomycetes bacterium]|nr:hypothetical protein [Planctomycetota bacterium]
MSADTKLRRVLAYVGPACPWCGVEAPHDRMASGMQLCRACGGEYEGEIFRPPTAPMKVFAVAEQGPAGANACANHERNAAVTACERCGHFICSLCRIDSDDMTLCPACFDRLAAEGALPSVRTTFRDYAGSASTAAMLGVLFWFIGPFIGPFAVYFGFQSFLQGRKLGEEEGWVRAAIAIVAGTLETLGGIVMLYFFSARVRAK